MNMPRQERVTKAIETEKFNVAISAMMSFTNAACASMSMAIRTARPPRTALQLISTTPRTALRHDPPHSTPAYLRLFIIADTPAAHVGFWAGSTD